jgi:hypothetical protein
MKQLSLPAHDKVRAGGYLVIHSAPSALRQHIEWGLQSLLGNSLSVDWKVQPHFPGTYRTTVEFKELRGMSAKIATALRNWHYLRFEVREETVSGGEYFRFTPDLGMHRSEIDGLGNIIVGEHLIEAALAKSFDEESIRESISTIFGKAWELELAPLRNVEIEEVVRLKAI